MSNARSPEAPTPAVEVLEARVEVSGLEILAPVSLSVPAGSALAIRGRNGSGKTTLLRLIAGLTRPSGGTVRVEGQHAAEGSPAFRRAVSAQLGLPAFAPDLTVREYLRYIAASWGEGDPEGAADGVLEELGIAALGARFAHELSSGQTQLFAVSTALVRPARILLLDEPEQRLDAERRELVSAAVTRRRIERGLTVVFASHNAAFIEAVAERSVTVQEP